MNTCIIFSFEFCGKKYYGASIPVANIDTNQYEKIWTHWGEFKGGVQTTDGHKLNVWFDYELTAEKDFTLQDTIGINNAYLNIYQKGEDLPIEIIQLKEIRRYETE
ncbi:MAG TPA: hypothetical protein DEQ84_00430 [Prevotellaceae bacterium]|nr:hypothetical protein [Prevotellaceae bacterium]